MPLREWIEDKWTIFSAVPRIRSDNKIFIFQNVYNMSNAFNAGIPKTRNIFYFNAFIHANVQKWINTIQYNTIQYNTIQYNTIQYNTIQYNTIQYNTIQYNTIQYNTIQYNTIQYNTIQYSTIQYKYKYYYSGINPVEFRGH